MAEKEEMTSEEFIDGIFQKEKNGEDKGNIEEKSDTEIFIDGVFSEAKVQEAWRRMEDSLEYNTETEQLTADGVVITDLEYDKKNNCLKHKGVIVVENFVDED